MNVHSYIHFSIILWYISLANVTLVNKWDPISVELQITIKSGTSNQSLSTICAQVNQNTRFFKIDVVPFLSKIFSYKTSKMRHRNQFNSLFYLIWTIVSNSKALRKAWISTITLELRKVWISIMCLQRFNSWFQVVI